MLLDELTVIQNLAMPFTLEIEPPPTRCGTARRRLAREVRPAGSGVDAAGRAGSTRRDKCASGSVARWRSIRRCCCSSTSAPSVERGSVQQLGADIAAVAAARGAALVALSADEAFARAVATRVLTLEPATGRLKERRRGWF